MSTENLIFIAIMAIVCWAMERFIGSPSTPQHREANTHGSGGPIVGLIVFLALIVSVVAYGMIWPADYRSNAELGFSQNTTSGSR